MPLRHLRRLRHLRHVIYVIHVNNDLNLENVLNNHKPRYEKMPVIQSVFNQLDPNLHRMCKRLPSGHTPIFVTLA